MNYDVDQVRERTDLLTLIGQHVALKKHGGRHIGICPFHQEKTPSFSVEAQKGFWHCFGCGKGGDAFTFLMQFEHLSFGEAVEKLAERAGVRPLEKSISPKRKEERDFLYEANAAAALAFSKGLSGKSGELARSYLQNRGINLEQAAKFGLGYAPAGWDALVNHLLKSGYKADILVKAGLALARSGGGNIDRFRNRLMIPIHDRQGRVVAFGGRAMVKEDNPKYLNTSETPVFHKSRMLYALNLAADTIAKRKRAIVTEGYFDVISCHLAGFTETVATLGTALGEEHVQILRRLAERVYLVFDADSAGVNAALRSQALFRNAEMDVRIVQLPAGHDPDTLLREEGAEAFERCLESALAPVEFELERLILQHPIKDAQDRVRLFREAAKVLKPLPKLERAEYALRLIDRSLGSARGDISELQQAVLAEIALLDRAPKKPSGMPAVDESIRIPDMQLECEVINAMTHSSEFAMSSVTLVPVEAFTHEGYRKVFQIFTDLVESGTEPYADKIITDDEQISGILAAMVMRDPLPLNKKELDTLIDRLLEEYEKRSIVPSEISLDDREKAENFTNLNRERGNRNENREFSDENEGTYEPKPMDEETKTKLAKFLKRR